MMRLHPVLTALLALLLSACGGGSSPTPTVETGRFSITNVGTQTYVDVQMWETDPPGTVRLEHVWDHQPAGGWLPQMSILTPEVAQGGVYEWEAEDEGGQIAYFSAILFFDRELSSFSIPY